VMRRQLASTTALCAALLLALIGCRDEGVIGTVERSADAGTSPTELCRNVECPADERCDEERGACVACGDGDDDDEDGCDTPADAGECTGNDCAQCDDDDQCADDLPFCDDGRCVQCEENGDCDGPGDLECRDGRCVTEDGEGE
jgi:hypothetical protein